MLTIISRIFIPLIAGLLWWTPALADIGLTHQLKQEREHLLLSIERARTDSLVNADRIDSLQQAVIRLDQRIFRSYDQTVSRMAAKERALSNNAKSVMFIALGTTAVALLLFLMMYALRQRVLRSQFNGLTGLFRQLLHDLIQASSYQQVDSGRFLRVNIVVIVGLVLMGVSILAFMLRIL